MVGYRVAHLVRLAHRLRLLHRLLQRWIRLEITWAQPQLRRPFLAGLITLRWDQLVDQIPFPLLILQFQVLVEF